MFDDAPTGDSPILTGKERSDRIVAHLKEHRVEQVAFFVVTRNISASSKPRLNAYVRAGHLLGNHSHSHFHIAERGTQAYLEDVRRADSLLRSHDGYVNWFVILTWMKGVHPARGIPSSQR